VFYASYPSRNRRRMVEARNAAGRNQLAPAQRLANPIEPLRLLELQLRPPFVPGYVGPRYGNPKDIPCGVLKSRKENPSPILCGSRSRK